MDDRFEHVLLNALGIHYLAVNPDVVLVMPNTGVILPERRYSPSSVKVICDRIADFVGIGDPIYSEDSVCRHVDGAVVLKDRGYTSIYIPKMSYMIVYGNEDEIYRNIENTLGRILVILVENGYNIRDLVRDKALRQYMNGKIVALPELKEEGDVIVEGGISRDIIVALNRYFGRILRSIVRNLRFKYVKNVGKINSISLDITLPIKKVVVAVKGEREFTLDTPIMLKGNITVDRDHVRVDGDLKYHPNINSEDGYVCLGTVPPFDGTLEWVARLLNTFMVARLDSCTESFSGVFVEKYEDLLPEGAVRLWKEECYEEDWDDEYYEEEDYDDDDDDD